MTFLAQTASCSLFRDTHLICLDGIEGSLLDFFHNASQYDVFSKDLDDFFLGASWHIGNTMHLGWIQVGVLIKIMDFQ